MINSCVSRSLLLLAVAAGTAAAQSTPSGPLTRPESLSTWRGLWIEAAGGIGEATGVDAGLAESLQMQRDAIVWSIRGDQILADIFDTDEISDVAAMVGWASTRRDYRFSSISVGPSFVHRSTCLRVDCAQIAGRPARTTAKSIGVAVSAEIAARTGDRGGVGFGLNAFANINSTRSFVGVAATISAGRWR